VPDDDDVARLARFVAARNHGGDRCLHLGDDVATVRRELEELETPCDQAWHLAEVDGEIVGAALVDVDEALGRAWLFGPWTADADDVDQAGRLLDAALDAVPPTVAQVDNFLDSANRRGVRLHEARGFRVERRAPSSAARRGPSAQAAASIGVQAGTACRAHCPPRRRLPRHLADACQAARAGFRARRHVAAPARPGRRGGRPRLPAPPPRAGATGGGRRTTSRSGRTPAAQGTAGPS
jgi:hypothetical protein